MRWDKLVEVKATMDGNDWPDTRFVGVVLRVYPDGHLDIDWFFPVGVSPPYAKGAQPGKYINVGKEWYVNIHTAWDVPPNGLVKIEEK